LEHVPTRLEGAAGNFGREQRIDYAEYYRCGTEDLDVVHCLWDSYEDGAFARDKANKVLLDTQCQHHFDHQGEFF
jgi:alkanesulfonate monooxygenase SsuD/methylene tetrahydromethanopterin reductase-like flavin-dependent oxidoreductase (luciferase family)